MINNNGYLIHNQYQFNVHIHIYLSFIIEYNKEQQHRTTREETENQTEKEFAMPREKNFQYILYRFHRKQKKAYQFSNRKGARVGVVHLSPRGLRGPRRNCFHCERVLALNLTCQKFPAHAPAWGSPRQDLDRPAVPWRGEGQGAPRGVQALCST